MSRRFLTQPCAVAPHAILQTAIADWMLSPERMRFREGSYGGFGTCLLCGSRTDGPAFNFCAAACSNNPCHFTKAEIINKRREIEAKRAAKADMGERL